MLSNADDYHKLNKHGKLLQKEPYVFTVTAINSVGSSVPSITSIDVNPIVIPDVPTNVLATTDDAQSKVSFIPGNNGGDSNVEYTVKTTPGAFADTIPIPDVTVKNSPIIVTGLKNGAMYQFSVSAKNSAGNSAFSESFIIK